MARTKTNLVNKNVKNWMERNSIKMYKVRLQEEVIEKLREKSIQLGISQAEILTNLIEKLYLCDSVNERESQKIT